MSTKLKEDLVTSSGKLAALDELLKVLLPQGRRVVLFSGWTSMLDIIEAFLDERGIAHARLDGSTNRVQRQIDIKQFNAKGSKLKVFMCSTRAGGLGITLTSADTVVLYDSDFNPQADLQAMDRVHRIGQTRPVTVLRLVTHGTVEERIVQRARDKIYLMQRTMTARGGETVDKSEEQAAPSAKVTRGEMIAMLQFGVAGALNAQKEGATGVTRAHIEQVLADIATGRAAGHSQVSVGVGGRAASDTKGDNSGEAQQLAAREALGDDDDEGAEAPRSTKPGDIFEAIEMGQAVEQLGRAAGRERTSRFIEVDGDLVLKINNYSLEEGEKSVFDSELKGKQERPSKRKSSHAQAGKDYENSSLCQLCWEGGDMICCDFCPNVMHAACCGIDDPSSLGSMWSCPHHKCVTCGRKAYAAGGLLFRCSECPKAYCEDHLPPQSELIGGEVDRLLALGFQAVKQACYVICSGECKDARCEHERRLQDEELVLENKEQDAEQSAAFKALEGEEGEEGEEGDDDEGDDDGNMEVDD